MVKVSIEVVDGSTACCFEVAVRAESIERALRLVAARYPKGQARVKFPIEPEGFFVVVEDRAARTGVVAEGFERQKRRRVAAS